MDITQYEIKIADAEQASEIRNKYSEADGMREYLTQLVEDHVVEINGQTRNMHMIDILDLARRIRNCAEEMIHRERKQKEEQRKKY